MIFIQWFVLLFVCGMFIKLVLDLQNSKISLRRFFFWSFIWICLVIIALFPETVLFLAGVIGIERAKDLPIYVSIVILFYLLFKFGLKIERLEQEITKLVKNLALKDKR